MHSYRVGDRVALYLIEPAAVPVLYGVIGVPEPRKDLVRRIDGPDAADRYGWVTPVEVRGWVPLAKAPKLRDFGLDARSLRNGRTLVSDAAAVRRIRRRLDGRTG